MTEEQRPDRARVVTYLMCLSAIVFLIVVGTIRGGGHG